MQAEQASLEAKNHELVDAFKEKTRSQQQTQKLYQALKAQVMASHVANAAGDEAEFTLQSVRGDRFIDRLPGTRTSTANFGQAGVGQQTSSGRPHNRDNSRSSRSGGQQLGGIRIGPSYTSHLQGRDSGGRVFTGRKSSLYCDVSGFGLDVRYVNRGVLTSYIESASIATPSHPHRSRLPVLGGTRQNPYLNPDAGSSYQASPISRQPLVGGLAARNLGSFGLGRTSSKRNGDSLNAGLHGQ